MIVSIISIKAQLESTAGKIKRLHKLQKEDSSDLVTTKDKKRLSKCIELLLMFTYSSLENTISIMH